MRRSWARLGGTSRPTIRCEPSTRPPNGVIRARTRDEALATAAIAVIATPTAYHLDDELAAHRVEESRPAPSGLAAAYRAQTAAFLGAAQRGTLADTPLVGIPEALTLLRMIAGL
jgi:hypothetical protein